MSGRRGQEHSEFCDWPDGPPCRRFSTDGTRVGADIAHTFGTTDESEIARMGWEELERNSQPLTGMDAEQEEWESLDLRAFPNSGPGLFGPRIGKRERTS